MTVNKLHNTCFGDVEREHLEHGHLLDRAARTLEQPVTTAERLDAAREFADTGMTRLTPEQLVDADII